MQADENITENQINKLPDVPYFLHEAEIARSETHTRRWMIAAAVAFVALILTNVGWIIYESQYQDVYTATQTVSQDSGEGGENSFEGDFYGGSNGKADDNKNNN